MNEQSGYRKWTALVAAFLIMAGPYSIINTIHSLFIHPVVNQYGFSLKSFSFVFTLSAIVIALASPAVGRAVGTIGLRPVMVLGALLAGGGFFAYGFARSIAAFYGIAAVVALGAAALTVIPLSAMISAWFPEKRGSMMGVAFAGAGAGSFVWMQAASRLLAAQGPAWTYRFLGLVMLAVALPLSLFCVSMPKGAPEGRQGQKGKGPAIDQPRFLLFAGGVFLMGAIVSGVQVHVQPYLASLGLPAVLAANVGSLLAAFALAGSMLGGWLFDKAGPARSLVTAGFLSIVSLLLLIVGGQDWLLYLFALTYGLSLCMPSLWPSYGSARLFPKEDYAATLGTVNLFFTAGAAAGPFVSGLLADSPWGYPGAWRIYLALTVLYYALFLLSLRARQE